MADLTNILGGPWRPQQKRIDSPEQQFINAIQDHGLTPPQDIRFDGKMYRFYSGQKKTEKTGWYVVFDDGIVAGCFGDWKLGISVNFRADMGRDLTIAEEMQLKKRAEEARKIRERELQRKYEIAADTVEDIWMSGAEANQDHPYLTKKGIKPHGSRVTGDGRLMVPLYHPDGHLSSLQYINEDGKQYHPGSMTGSCYWWLGDLDNAKTIYVAEGFATGATIYEVMGIPVVIAYSASNLPHAVKNIRDKFGSLVDVVIVADNDASEVGLKYADQACAKHGARYILCPINGDVNDYYLSGGDLKSLLSFQNNEEWLIPADEFSSKPAPIRWLVKHWLPENSMIMVHGPSGGGKTFTVLDWCMSLASGLGEWFGYKTKTANIIYLAGEGHYGLKARITAWKQEKKVNNLKMWVSKDGCDLNTPDGYMKVINNLRTISEKPDLIVVDTLHRFLAGDENSSQDAKTMLDACAGLMRDFECSVLLVHHTGVSDEAQHRARGSSAWKGALDAEFSVLPGRDDNPMQIICRKMKDAEMPQTIYASLKRVEVIGWFDEDGEQVTSAVLSQEDEPVETTKRTPKIDEYRQLFENAWFHSGCELVNGIPYLSRSALRNKLENDGFATRTIDNMMKPSETNKMIGKLIQEKMISNYQHGWIVTDKLTVQTLLIKLNE